MPRVRTGLLSWQKKVKIKAQHPTTVDVLLVMEGKQNLNNRRSSSKERSLGPLITLGAGLALIGGSTYTGVSADRLYTQLEDRRNQQLLIATEDINTGSNLVLMTNILIGLGAAGLTAGGVWWFMDEQPPQGRGMLRRRAEIMPPPSTHIAYTLGGQLHE